MCPRFSTCGSRGLSGRNVILIAYLIFVVQLSDVMQYVWGKLVGRTKVAPNLSPSKTWEGLIGGALTASGVGTALWWMTPFSPLQAAGMCLHHADGLLRRPRHVGDQAGPGGSRTGATSLPGTGGFLDRLDSVIFAAPTLFHITRWL